MKAIPHSVFSWNFTIADGPRTLARLETSPWREKGALTIAGVVYRAYREGFMAGDFIVESDGTELARATKPSAFRRSFVITHDGMEYTLTARSAFRREFVLLQGERRIGSISPDGLFTRKANVDLPDIMPLPLKAFVVWLAILLWRRQTQNSGSGG
jgi:hypothetical protein